MSLRQKLADIVTAEIGKHEEGGNNVGPDVVKYQQACVPTLYPSAYPWCCALPCWGIQQLEHDAEVIAELDITDFDKWRPREVGVWGMIKWAQAHGYEILDNTTPAEVGDLIIFDFQGDNKPDHIGVCVQNQVDIKNPVVTVDGNVGATEKSDANTGDVVGRRGRDNKTVFRKIRIVKPATT